MPLPFQDSRPRASDTIVAAALRRLGWKGQRASDIPVYPTVQPVVIVGGEVVATYKTIGVSTTFADPTTTVFVPLVDGTVPGGKQWEIIRAYGSSLVAAGSFAVLIHGMTKEVAWTRDVSMTVAAAPDEGRSGAVVPGLAATAGVGNSPAPVVLQAGDTLGFDKVNTQTGATVVYFVKETDVP